MNLREPGLLALATIVICLVLGLHPHADRFTWLLENLPVLVGLPVAVWLHRRHSITPLVCRLLAVHAVILMIGGHYTYAEVPAGFWVRDLLGLARNPYDRLGHLAQGFVPVMVMREVLLRSGTLRRGWLAGILLVLAALGISALYELAEWQAVVWTGAAADAFLGTQGDIWDTQWDMACCGLGALVALLCLSRLHDRSLARILAQTSSTPEK
jgi:putative membrane protein